MNPLAVCRIDFETRSKLDLKKVGAYRYAMDSSTEVLCISYQLNNEIKTWTKWDKEPPFDLLEHVALGGPIEAHNAGFEFAVWNYCFVRGKAWPRLELEQLSCSAAKAAASSLPRALEDVCIVLKTKAQKDIEGHKLMLRMSKPRKPTKANPALYFEEQNKLQRLFEYNRADVIAEAEISKLIRPLSSFEQEVWRLTETINHRGIYCDVENVKVAKEFARRFELELTEELRRLTGGTVMSAKQVSKIVEFLNTLNFSISDLTAKSVSDALKMPDLNPRVKRILEIRALLSKSSVAKLDAMLKMACEDNRIRGALLYHGASTGRHSGKGIQPQNFTRGTIKDTKTLFRALSIKDYDLFKALYSDVFTALSSALRGMLRAEPGKTLYAADFNAIEARVLLWLAEDKDNLIEYKKGIDPYKTMASLIFSKPYEAISKDERHLGKTTVLGCIAKGAQIKVKEGQKIKHIKIENLKNQEVWDGEKWATHQGLLKKGPKKVILMKDRNLESTWNHWFLKQNLWQTAAEIVLQEAIQVQKSELETASLLLSPKNLKSEVNAASKFAVFAELLNKCESTTFIKEKIACVFHALKKPFQETTDPESIAKFLETLDLEENGLPHSTMLGSVVKTLTTPTLKITALAEFESTSNPFENSWNTLFHLMGGTTGKTLLIVSTQIRATKEEILDLYHKAKTIETVERETFDIFNCGPDNRFEVNGIIAHNCGYQMGPEKFQASCHAQGLEISEELAQKAVSAYREKHSNVKNFWYDLERAAIKAVKRPNRVLKFRKLEFLCKNNFLLIRLPSKRILSYYNPRVEEIEMFGSLKDSLTYESINSVTRKWEETRTYGGKLVENVTQAVARDLMVEAMVKLEKAGFPIILTVHDELIAEADPAPGALEKFIEIMSSLPNWANDLPIKVEGYEAERFKK